MVTSREEMEGTTFKSSFLPLLIRILANLGQQRLKHQVVQVRQFAVSNRPKEANVAGQVGSSIPRAPDLTVLLPHCPEQWSRFCVRG